MYHTSVNDFMILNIEVMVELHVAIAEHMNICPVCSNSFGRLALGSWRRRCSDHGHMDIGTSLEIVVWRCVLHATCKHVMI